MYNRRRNDLRTLLMDHLDLGPEAAYMDEATFQEACTLLHFFPSRRPQGQRCYWHCQLRRHSVQSLESALA